MVSLFNALNISSNALKVNESAISVVSHNVANMNTEGYSKQRVHLATRNIAGAIGDSTEAQIRANGGVMIANVIRNNEAYLLNMHISLYDEGNIHNHEEERTRKLLLHKKEILKLQNKINLEGYTIIALKLYMVKQRAKILIGVAKGKKNYDKRESIKKKDMERQVAKDLKNL